ncbi:MAG TPA: hypothetical protein VEU11_00035 [Terriglobales bacterium]|nr:hypothetical protein [Terriglobales bacterium]
MPTEQETLKHFAFAVGGGTLGALLVKSHYDEAKKSRAEKEDPEGVEWICSLIDDLLEEWTPRSYETEDEYTKALYRYLNRRIPEELEEDDEVDVDLWPTTHCGVPDILINGQLVLELKLDPDKGGRDRGIGQCADYSREWLTWLVVIGSPAWRIQELEELLAARRLEGIKVVSFT